MTNLKTKWMVFKVNQMVSDELCDKCFDDPENEELEAFSDRAYEEMWKSLEEFAAEMESFTNGEVDVKTAKRLALCPKYSGRLEELMARWAA